MSTASLASPRALAGPTHPDRVRIAAMSAALAVNLGVLMFAARPLPPQAFRTVRTAPALTVQYHHQAPPPAKNPPPPPDTPPLPRAPAAPAAIPTVPRAITTPPMSEQGSRPLRPAGLVPALLPSLPAPAAVSSPGSSVSLAYRRAPLSYPARAVARRMEGTVLLRVLVDDQGRPVQVQLLRSSGYPLLDRSARQQVLAGWRFEPARIDGRPVSAWARVPVRFALRRL